MTTRTAFERDVLDRVAAQYRTAGFRVVREPAPSDLPAELAQFRPDMIAVRDTETVVVEVKIGADASSLAQLDALTAAAQRIGWRVDFVSEPREGPRDWDRAKRTALLSQADQLTALGQLEAAVLVGWAAIEAALRAATRQRRLPTDDRLNPRVVVDTAYSQGLIGERARSRFLSLIQVRNGVAHGKATRTPSASAVQAALSLGAWVNSDAYASPDEMSTWFLANFEDPANSIFFDSAEGGYQYPPGEPHDASEALSEHFELAPEDAINDARDLIDPEGGPDWIRQ